MSEKPSSGLKHLKSIFRRNRSKDAPSGSHAVNGKAGGGDAPQFSQQPEASSSEAPSLPMPQHPKPLQMNEDSIIAAQKLEPEPPRSTGAEPEPTNDTPSNPVTKPLAAVEEPPTAPPTDPEPEAAAEQDKAEDATPEKKEDPTGEDVSKQEQEEARKNNDVTQPEGELKPDDPLQTPKPTMSATSGPLEDIPAFVQ